MVKCRIDHHDAIKIISYGKMPIANGFLAEKDFETEYFFELSAAFSPKTMLFQLIEQPDLNRMFHESYAFFSSTSKNMAEHFQKMAEEYLEQFIPEISSAFIIELGSNDGIMLQHFANRGIKHLGVEPSLNVAQAARERGVKTISEFFTEACASKILNSHQKADIISAANVLCHIPNLDSVAKGITLLLKERGVFIFEDPYLGDMIQKTSYDQIYDEHVYMFSTHSVINVFFRHGLTVFHVSPQKTHGGSMRYYLCRSGVREIQSSVNKQLEFELSIGLDKVETYKNFARNCAQSREKLIQLLKRLKAENKRVVGYAATSKSTTILNYCGIGPDLIEYICDTTPIKQGKYSPGMHIPIRSHEFFQNDSPDYAILFAWNHADEIFEKEQAYMERGGKWIRFVPSVEILNTPEEALTNAY